jgi:HK97 gp10 family phage protein
MSLSFKATGFEQLAKKLNNIGGNAKADVSRVLASGATRIVAGAKRNSTAVDTGRLRASIAWERLEVLSVRILAGGTNVGYAPYIEFGTGKFVDVPAELTEYAAGFKGKGTGTFEDMKKYILAWMVRKGIKPEGKQTLKGLAYIISVKLLTDGMKAKPFLFPAFFNERPKIIAEIEDVLKKYTI